MSFRASVGISSGPDAFLIFHHLRFRNSWSHALMHVYRISSMILKVGLFITGPCFCLILVLPKLVDAFPVDSSYFLYFSVDIKTIMFGAEIFYFCTFPFNPSLLRFFDLPSHDLMYFFLYLSGLFFVSLRCSMRVRMWSVIHLFLGLKVSRRCNLHMSTMMFLIFFQRASISWSWLSCRLTCYLFLR